MIENSIPSPDIPPATLNELIAAVPEPKPQEATKLPEPYDGCLLGYTVNPYGADQFCYSLRKLTLFLMREYDCPVAEARHILTKNFLMPHSGTVTFVNDEAMLGAIEDEKKIQIVTKGAFGKGKR